jgi:CRP/FNR family cyclic AMP-dependent transcriptional regulator
MGLVSFAGRTRPDQVHTEELLKGLAIFSKLTDRQIRKLARLFTPRQYAKGDILIKKGETGLGMFVIRSGCVEVFDVRDSNRVTLATLGAGKCVGEMSLMDERPRSANVEALEQTDCLLITRDSFNGLTRRDAEILWGIVPMLVERLRHADARLTGLVDVEAGPAPVVVEAPAGAPVVVRAAEPAPVVRVVEARSRVRSDADARAREREEELDDAEETQSPEQAKGQGIATSMIQLSTATFVFWSSAFLLGTQESLRVFWSRGSIGENLSQSEEVVSSLTQKFEDNMNTESKRLFGAMQELMSSVVNAFQR